MGAGGIGAGVGSAVGGIIALATDKGIPDEYKDVVKLWEALQTPNFDMRELPPPLLNVVAQVSPQTYEAVIAAPAVTAQDSPVGRDAQLRALDYFERVQREGIPEAERLAAQGQQVALSNEAARANEATIEGLAARGRLGGGTELAARVGMGAGAQNAAAQSGNALAMESLNRRWQAANQAGALGGQVRGQDVDLSKFNSSVMNRFNEWMSKLQTDAQRYAAGERGRTDTANANNRQRVADANTYSRYETSRDNLSRRNALLDQDFGNRVTRLGGQSSALLGLAQAKDADEAARQQNIRGIGRGIGQAAGGAFGLGG